MSDRTREFDAEETKLLTESISDGEARIGPSDEYAAKLRRRLLSVTVPAQLTPESAKHRILLGSLCGACAAALLIAAIWMLRAEPAWASAIRRARDQAWIHGRVERDGVWIGDTWVSPEQDIVAARSQAEVLFCDYKRNRFIRYDARDGIVVEDEMPATRRSTPETASSAQLAEVFRRSAGSLSLFPGQRIEHWNLHSAIIDGIPCDDYEIVSRAGDEPSTTTRLIVDKRQSLPVSVVRIDGESHTTSFRFEYPATGPSDERSPLLEIPSDAPTFDAHTNEDVREIVGSLKQGRREFDDYTAFVVTPGAGVALERSDVIRTLRKGDKWRTDSITLSAPKLFLPMDNDQALKALRANRNQLRLTPEVICDGKEIHCYRWMGKSSSDGLPIQSFRLSERAPAGSLASDLYFPERAARPMFFRDTARHEVASEQKGPFAGLLRVDVSQPPTGRNPSPPPPDLYWLDPKLGNVAVTTVVHPVPPKTGDSKLVTSPSFTEFKTTFSDFKQSPRGYWYPVIVDRGTTTRFYVDFNDIPSDDMFKKDHPAP